MARRGHFILDPDAVLDFTFDWSEWLADGETISSVSFSVPSGLTEESSTHDDTTATVWLSTSSSQAGNTFVVTCHIATSAGRQDDRSILITVQER